MQEMPPRRRGAARISQAMAMPRWQRRRCRNAGLSYRRPCARRRGAARISACSGRALGQVSSPSSPAPALLLVQAHAFDWAIETWRWT